MPQRLRILHISDLHLGKEGQGVDAWRMQRVLGKAWLENLRTIAADGKPDIVCFTGDLAQSGKAQQYAAAGNFLDACLGALGVGREALFLVPGNHDVDRSIKTAAWRKLREAAWHNPSGLSKWMAGGKAPFGFYGTWREAILARQQAFRTWQAEFFAPRQPLSSQSLLGQRFSLNVKHISLHLIALDSAWLAGDENDQGKLRLGEEQIMHLLRDQHGQPLPGLKIVLLHHPLSELADEDHAQRLLRECGADLILHGHVHKARQVRWQPLGDAASLLISAAGCLYEKDSYPNSLRVLDLEWEQEAQPQMRLLQIWQRVWSQEGHWHDDDAWHKDSRQGRLRFTGKAAEDAPPAPTYKAGEHIFGRDDELSQLQQAFAGDDSRPVAICCAVEGMPGVGKSWLAAAFIQQSAWRERHLRLALPESQDIQAEAIARTLLDHMQQMPAPPAHLSAIPALRAALRQSGKLLLLENVDSAAQAEQVALLVAGLPGCKLLLTARHKEFGLSPHCRAVALGPLAAGDALALLRAEAPACKDDEASLLQLVAKLGGLALALHIAASHLQRGRSVAWFLAEMEKLLAQGSADKVDAALRQAHEAARMILYPSFAISWNAWCDQHQDQADMVQALARLAHGPDGGCGPSLGAAISACVPPEQISKQTDARYENLVREASEWSLLGWDGETCQLRWHPLLQQWLRSKMPQAKAEAEQAWLDWLLARLPLPEGQSGEWEAWKQVQEEEAALRMVLQTCSQEAGRDLGQVAGWYAHQMGPFALWQTFAARILQGLDEKDKVRLALYWMVGRCAMRTGDLAQAGRGAEQYKELAVAMGDERDQALAAILLADLADAYGYGEQAMRIRKEVLPVLAQIGDPRTYIVTQGQIADVLQARGEWEEALRIRREEELPVYELLGDQRSRAVTQSKIADALHALGQRQEAVRIYREQVLPVYQRLGEKRLLLVGRGNFASYLLQDPSPALRSEAWELLQLAQQAARELGIPEAEQIAAFIKLHFPTGNCE